MSCMPEAPQYAGVARIAWGSFDLNVAQRIGGAPRAPGGASTPVGGSGGGIGRLSGPLGGGPGAPEQADGPDEVTRAGRGEGARELALGRGDLIGLAPPGDRVGNGRLGEGLIGPDEISEGRPHRRGRIPDRFQ